MVSLSIEEQDALILAFIDPGGDCAHTMIPAFAAVEQIVARHVAAALGEAAEACAALAGETCRGCDSCDGSAHAAYITAAYLMQNRANAANDGP